jgi:hypothetical protein
MMVATIDGKICIDEAEQKIYGCGTEIPTYGEYK